MNVTDTEWAINDIKYVILKNMEGLHHVVTGVEVHPNSASFYDHVVRMVALHAVKQRDYGSDGDPFCNVRNSEDFGVDGWVGCMMRANDKMKRIQSFAQKGVLANEGVEDSLLDLAVYSLIALVLFQESVS